MRTRQTRHFRFMRAARIAGCQAESSRMATQSTYHVFNFQNDWFHFIMKRRLSLLSLTFNLKVLRIAIALLPSSVNAKLNGTSFFFSLIDCISCIWCWCSIFINHSLKSLRNQSLLSQNAEPPLRVCKVCGYTLYFFRGVEKIAKIFFFNF